MMKTFVQWRTTVIFVLAIPISCLLADTPLPEGWRIPSSTETTADQEWRNRDLDRYLIVKADFNGDGITDQARLLLRDQGSGFGLFAFVSQSNHTFKSYLLDEKKDPFAIRALGIVAVPPGRYKTACGKGYADCGKGETPEISLRHPAIDYFKEESANMYFYWDEVAETFREAWISD